MPKIELKHVNKRWGGFYAVEGPSAAPLWHMAMSEHCVGATGSACPSPSSQADSDSSDAWVSREHEITAFASAPDKASDGEAFTTYSYIDVLRGHIPAAAFKGKYVLLGATAAGLGEKFTAPLGIGFAPVTPLALGVFMFSWMVALPAFVMGQIVSLILIFTRVRSLAPLLSPIFSGLFLGSAALFLMMSGRA